ncbi:MAG: (2Fe-2S)-binding protein [Rubrivivax sp.]
MPSFGYASALPFGREPDGSVGVVFRAGHVEPVDAALLQAVESALGLVGARVLRYADPKRGQHRAIRLDDSGDNAEHARLQAFVLAGDVRAEAWVLPLWRDQQPARAFGARLLAANATRPAALVARGAQVCTCFDIGEAQIIAALARIGGPAETRLARLQDELRCGSNCGSCKPALRVLVGRCLEAA